MEHTMPKMIMLIGLPATGKSTFTEKFLADKNPDEWVVVSSDAHIEKFANETGVTYNEAFPIAIKHATRQLTLDAEAAILANKNVIWDQTNLNAKTRANKIRMFPTHYEIEGRIFGIPYDIEERLKNRPGKIIPEKILHNMRSTYEAPEFTEGFDRIVFNS